MAPSDKVNEQTKNEWNTLGFYYDCDDDKGFWQIIGSKEGILKFCKLLEDYSNNGSKQNISEDEHFGPYSYLKFMTWNEPKIAKREICGRQSDFKILSDIIKHRLKTSNENFQVDKEYSNNNEYRIEFIIKEESFEPASADSQLKKS